MSEFFEGSFWTSGYPWGILIATIMIVYTVLEGRRK